LEEVFRKIFQNIHFEVTASGNFSNKLKLKSQIGRHRDIIFVFLKKGTSPDITGFVDGLKEEYKIKYGYYEGFVVAEIKKDEIKLDDIYQVRKYAELLDARYAFLISLEPIPIPEEIKRLSQSVYTLLSLPAYQTLILACFDDKDEKFVDFYPKEPFK
jgi:hypothetical protein